MTADEMYQYQSDPTAWTPEGCTRELAQYNSWYVPHWWPGGMKTWPSALIALRNALLEIERLRTATEAK